MKSYQSPAATAMPGATSSLEVNITSDLASVDVMHQGRKLMIKRNQNQSNAVNPDFAVTSRACPPFCIQPSELAPGVKSRRYAGLGRSWADNTQAIGQITC